MSTSRQACGHWLLATPSLSSKLSRGGAMALSSAKRAQSFLSWRRRMERSLATRSRERAST